MYITLSVVRTTLLVVTLSVINIYVVGCRDLLSRLYALLYEGISMTKFNNLKVKRVESNLKYTESKLVKKKNTVKGHYHLGITQKKATRKEASRKKGVRKEA